MATVINLQRDTRAESLGQAAGGGLRILLERRKQKKLDEEQKKLLAEIAKAKDKGEASTLALSNQSLSRDPDRLAVLAAQVDASFPELDTLEGFTKEDEPVTKTFTKGQPPPSQDEDFFLAKRQPFTIPTTDKQGRTTLSAPIEARTREEAQELFAAAGLSGRPLDAAETKIQEGIINRQIDREKIKATKTGGDKLTDAQLELKNLAEAEGLNLDNPKQQLIARNLVPKTFEGHRSNFEQLLTTSFGKDGFAIFAKSDAALVTEGTVNLRAAIREGVEPAKAIKIAHLDVLKEKALAAPSELLGVDTKNNRIDAATKQSAVEGFIRAMGITPEKYEASVNSVSAVFKPGIVNIREDGKVLFQILVLPNGVILPWGK